MKSNNCIANYYSLFFALLFLSFAVLSNITLPGRPYGETGYIEEFQVILIVSILILGFVRKVFLVNVYSRFTYLLRQSFFGLLFFEEISYLTANKFNFSEYNLQSEFNFHNSLEIPEVYKSPPYLCSSCNTLLAYKSKFTPSK